MPSVSWLPIVSTGLRLVSGSWKIIRDLGAPNAAHLGLGEGEQVATAEEDAPVLDAAGRFRQEPRDGKAE